MTISSDTVLSNDSAVIQAADRLLLALDHVVPCAPVRELIGPDDVTAAYRVQERLTTARVEGGASIVGRKIGATSLAVQQQLGVDQPDFGVLFDDMALTEDQLVPMNRLVQPKVEAEVAFVLGQDLVSGSLDVAQCRAAVKYAVAALEVVDSRIADWDIRFSDTVADNASAGLYLLGDQRRTLDEFVASAVEMSMVVNDEVVSTGSGTDCLGDPLNALSWLAVKAREFGEPLRAGQVILSGALGPMHAVQPGDQVSAQITGLGSVNARFGIRNTTEMEKKS